MRYLPQNKKDTAAMLSAIGAASVDELFHDVPKKAFVEGLVELPSHKGELHVERDIAAYAEQNHAASDGPFFLGAGCYYHHIPASVDYIIQRSEFLTAYTPYQPEIAQGTLMAIFEFQTYIARLTGQDIANASLYDGATSMAEAALMAMRLTKRSKIILGNALHPDYTDVLDTYMRNHEATEIYQTANGKMPDLDEDTACLIIQSPDFYGTPHDYDEYRKMCDACGAKLIVVVTEIVSLGLLPAPENADIVCGEAQSIGLPMSFGGPHLGFFACKEEYVRQMPGRLCGETTDIDGKRSFVLTLNTREQHIRRDKATSNICTNQGLCALAFTVHLSLLGEDGLKHLARLNHESAIKTADALTKINGITLQTEAFFNEFTITVNGNARDIVKTLADKGIIAGYAIDNTRILLAATEMTTDEDRNALCDGFRGALS